MGKWSTNSAANLGIWTSSPHTHPTFQLGLCLGWLLWSSTWPTAFFPTPRQTPNLGPHETAPLSLPPCCPPWARVYTGPYSMGHGCTQSPHLSTSPLTGLASCWYPQQIVKYLLPIYRFFKIYIYFWLPQVLVGARGLGSCSAWA